MVLAQPPLKDIQLKLSLSRKGLLLPIIGFLFCLPGTVRSKKACIQRGRARARAPVPSLGLSLWVLVVTAAQPSCKGQRLSGSHVALCQLTLLHSEVSGVPLFPHHSEIKEGPLHPSSMRSVWSLPPTSTMKSEWSPPDSSGAVASVWR